MTDTDQHATPRSGPDCGSFSNLLPLLGAGTLEAREEDRLRLHLATCAYCQLQQATYNRMDLAMRRYFGASAPLLFSPEDVMSLTDQEPMAEPPLRAPSAPFRSPMQRSRRVFTWVAAVAAVMVIALLTTALFISHRPSKPQTANPPSATTGQSSTLTVYGSSDFSDDANNPPSADSTLFALDAATGKVRWTNTSKTTERMLPVVADGVFYIGASDGTVSAYQASDGKLLWSQKLLDNSFVDQVADGVVIAHSFNKNDKPEGAGGPPATIFALDASTGHELWRFTKGVIPQAFIDGTVYAAKEGNLSIQQGVLYAINARDGSERWEFQSQGSPMVDQVVGGQVFVLAQWVVGNDGSDERALFYAVDAATGQQHWVYPKNPTTSLNTVGMENGLIFLESNLGAVKSSTGVNELDAVSTSDGSLSWKLPLKEPYDGATDDNGVIYVVMNHTISAYQASDGQLLSSTPVRDGAYFAAAVNGVYYLYLNTGMIAVDASLATSCGTTLQRAQVSRQSS
jgi:outer membrane protein assembly factor BamB